MFVSKVLSIATWLEKGFGLLLGAVCKQTTLYTECRSFKIAMFAEKAFFSCFLLRVKILTYVSVLGILMEINRGLKHVPPQRHPQYINQQLKEKSLCFLIFQSHNLSESGYKCLPQITSAYLIL